MKYKKFKVKEGREAQWRSWCAILNIRRKEVLETMKEEKVTREACWIFDGYIYYGMEGLCLLATDCGLNREHRRNRRECFEVPSTEVAGVPEGAEELFDFWFIPVPTSS